MTRCMSVRPAAIQIWAPGPGLITGPGPQGRYQA
jgi:hypothetical protein